ncbi:hypothetical protein ACQKD6_23680 [Bacillus cereus]|uniref:hypothetical protein n=1 Tax=Bacillus cereus TaxID=1396 RepID=UPI003CFC44E5
MNPEQLIEKYNMKLVEHLESFFQDAEVYQDAVQEDEANLTVINHVVFETGGFERTSPVTFKQDVIVYFFSENREDLDILQLTFMNSLSTTGHTCSKTVKDRMRKKDTEYFVDVIRFDLSRAVKHVC